MKLKSFLLSLTLLAALPTYAGTITGILQGPSGIVVKNATLTFQLQQVGLLVGTGAIANTSASCYSSSDGTIVGLPNPLTLPNVSLSTGSGTLPGAIYYVEYSFSDGLGGESLPSPERQIQLTSTGSLILSPPATFPPKAAGMNVYIGTASGNETLQGSTASSTASYTQAIPLVAGNPLPTTNSSVCSIAFNDTIIPYMGYNVSLISASGNSYPGWPQAWQLNGGLSGTINVSAGAPLWNGVVIYPMPILSQPLNHGPQSISGNLDFGGYNVTNVGKFTAGTIDSVVNPTLQAGSDIGAQINTSLAGCANQCAVKIPAGTYSFSTPISLPLNALNTYTILCDPGTAQLSYTGNADAIVGPVNTLSPTTSALNISGCTLIGTAAATSGIHLQPTNTVHITNMLIEGFFSGPAIWFEGVNAAWIEDNLISNNLVGIQNTPTFCAGANCGITVTGTGYTPNAVHILNNTIVHNTQWGVLFADPVTNTLTGALSDEISGNDLELNGSQGVQYGAVNVGRSTGMVISRNYFEGSPREIVLGIPNGGTAFFGSNGAVVRDDYFTLSTSTLYEIELINANSTVVEGNTTLNSSSGASNCFINATTPGGSNVGESNTFVGHNQVILSSGSNLLCIGGTGVLALTGAGSYTAVNTNYQWEIVNSNYALISAGTSETVSLAANVTAASSCMATPANSTSAAIAPSLALIPTGVNTGTLYHGSGIAGTRWNLSCSPGPYN